MLTETIRARGHRHVTGTHNSTFEVTTEDWLTPAGDCILGIEADRAPADFEAEFKSVCQAREQPIEIFLEVGDLSTLVLGRGDPNLTFADSTSSVVRTSTYIDDRTVAIQAEGAATDIDREMISALAEGAELVMTLRVPREGRHYESERQSRSVRTGDLKTTPSF